MISAGSPVRNVSRNVTTDTPKTTRTAVTILVAMNRRIEPASSDPRAVPSSAWYFPRQGDGPHDDRRQRQLPLRGDRELGDVTGRLDLRRRERGGDRLAGSCVR